MYFWIGKRDRKNRWDVIFTIRLKRKKEERKEELTVRQGKESMERRFDRKVGVSGKISTFYKQICVSKMLCRSRGF